MAQIGYANEYSYVVITIKNQPFTPFDDSQGNPIGLFYQVQIKNHNETDNWLGVYRLDDGYQNSPRIPGYPIYLLAVEGESPMGVPMLAGTQIDIQVNANEGYIGREILGTFDVPYVFVGLTSNWSNTQTVTVPANVPLSPTPAPSSTTTQTQTSTYAPQTALNSTLLLITTIALVVVAAFAGGDYCSADLF